MCLDPIDDLGEMLVLLPNVVLFAKVDEEDDWFCCEEEKRVDVFDLFTYSQCAVEGNTRL